MEGLSWRDLKRRPPLRVGRGLMNINRFNLFNTTHMRTRDVRIQLRSPLRKLYFTKYKVVSFLSPVITGMEHLRYEHFGALFRGKVAALSSGSHICIRCLI